MTTVLLTGASGVVGSALLDALSARFDVICLTHRTPVAGWASVAGDVREPRLGLPADAYRDLARRVDAIVHSAGAGEFGHAVQELTEVNVGGTERIVQLAQDADALLYHVSTALVAHPGDGTAALASYLASKRQSEDVVRSSGVPGAIVRPSMLIGNSRTGEISRFQFVYLLFRAFFEGLLPVGPADPQTCADLVPCDVVGDAVAEIVGRAGEGQGEHWPTGGAASLTVAQVAEVCVEFSRHIGRPVDPPRLVPQDVFDRLIRPVFLPALPPRMRTTMSRVLEMFGGIASPSPYPSTLSDLGVALPDPATSLRRSLEHWAAATGFTKRRRSNAERT